MSEPAAGTTPEAGSGPTTPGPLPASDPTRFSLGEWHEIAEGVHRLVAEPESVNVGLVVGEHSALLVDTGSSPEQGQRIRAAVRAVTELPLVAVVVTHAHYDHWFGLGAFGDITSIGHETLAGQVESAETLARLESLGLSRGDLALPTRSLSLVAAIDLGGRRAEIVHLGPAHSEGDLIVVVSESGVVFAGDLVEQPVPVFGEDSSPAQWPAALDAMVGLLRPETKIVPGHGEVMDPAEVMQQSALLHQINFEAARLVSSGVRLEDAAEQGEWPLPWEQVAAGVRLAYGEQAARGEVPRPRLPMADG